MDSHGAVRQRDQVVVGFHEDLGIVQQYLVERQAIQIDYKEGVDRAEVQQSLEDGVILVL